ncbi:hypothetical protein ACFVP8_18390 [Viridibacillus arvi]
MNADTKGMLAVESYLKAIGNYFISIYYFEIWHVNYEIVRYASTL